MRRLGSSDSLGALISIPSAEEKSIGDNHVYSRGFQYMIEEEEYGEESGQISEKKRRLSVNQVKALEKNFDVENKLEPERKVKLAQELGLQPRQVAVWFQNRRARGKTKQLERDYGLLKANYDGLKLNYDALQHDKEALLAELRELKSKIHGETSDKKVSIKEENIFLPETEDRAEEQSKISTAMEEEPEKGLRSSLFKELKEGSSDSDSSAILNEDNSPKAATSSSAIFQQHHLMMSPSASSTRFNCSSSSLSSINCLPFSDSKVISVNTQKAYQHQFERMEELNFFSGEESCNFFSDDQAPTLQWYCSDQWN